LGKITFTEVQSKVKALFRLANFGIEKFAGQKSWDSFNLVSGVHAVIL